MFGVAEDTSGLWGAFHQNRIITKEQVSPKVLGEPNEVDDVSHIDELEH